jgi:hypothetical protein
MARKLASPGMVLLLVGLVLGLGGALLVRPAQAVATDHSDEFAIATGFLSTELEAVYLLDFKAGQLLGTVLNSQSGQFQDTYKRDLTKDFSLNPRQKPKFIMVTGAFRVAAAQVPVNHVLYVAELNSGRMGAYYMPYRGERIGGVVTEELKVMHIVPFRQTAPLRQQ